MKSFKELLLKKSQFNEELNEFLSAMDETLLKSHLLEILEKAEHSKDSASRKKTINYILTHYSEAKRPFDHKLIHDAMSHHASNAISAHQDGNEELRDRHAFQFVKLGDLARRLDATDNPINFEPPASLSPWQANTGDAYASSDKGGFNFPNWNIHHPDKNFAIRIKDKEPKQKTSQKISSPEGEGQKKAPRFDMAHMFSPPHPDHEYRDEKGIMNAEKASGEKLSRYPFELTKVAGKYLNIKPTHSGEYEPHIMDSHPIMDHFSISNKKVKEESGAEYADKMSNWLGRAKDPEHQNHQKFKMAMHNFDNSSHPTLVRSAPVKKESEPST